MTPLAERAVITSTGETVLVLRRRSIATDQAIMDALEAAGMFVIGTPHGFRYRRPNKRRFTHPGAADVFLLDEDGKAVTAVVPGPYFTAHYRVTGAVRAER